MPNKKLALIVSVITLFVSTAAFLAGILLNQKLNSRASFEDLGSILIPAPELPTTRPQAAGPFIERQDGMLILESRSLGASGLRAASPASTRTQRGTRVEVVVTSKTMIYRDTTDADVPFSAENPTVQQTVEAATLDDLNPECAVMVWGRKSGDRIIAEVLIYSHLAEVKRAIFQDCEICP